MNKDVSLGQPIVRYEDGKLFNTNASICDRISTYNYGEW